MHCYMFLSDESLCDFKADTGSVAVQTCSLCRSVFWLAQKDPTETFSKLTYW